MGSRSTAAGSESVSITNEDEVETAEASTSARSSVSDEDEAETGTRESVSVENILRAVMAGSPRRGLCSPRTTYTVWHEERSLADRRDRVVSNEPTTSRGRPSGPFRMRRENMRIGLLLRVER